MIPNVFWLIILAAFLAVWSGRRLWIIEYNDRLLRQRLDGFRGVVIADEEIGRPSWSKQLSNLLLPIMGVVRQQYLRKMLTTAGFKSQTSLANLLAIKALVAVVLLGVVSLIPVLASAALVMRLVLLGMAAMAGWQLPNIVLDRLAKRRQFRLQQGMPDALDLLVICAEAGLSLNQAIDEISVHLREAHKDVADEFVTTSAEMRVLSDVGQALDNLVERTNLSNLTSLIAALKQSLQFGTPLVEALRTIANEMRNERYARMEERAARLPVVLALPMMMFILPSLLMIIGTPVGLRLMDTFANFSFGGGGNAVP
jgi:tight adherence protein C